MASWVVLGGALVGASAVTAALSLCAKKDRGKAGSGTRIPVKKSGSEDAGSVAKSIARQKGLATAKSKDGGSVSDSLGTTTGSMVDESLTGTGGLIGPSTPNVEHYVGTRKPGKRKPKHVVAVKKTKAVAPGADQSFMSLAGHLPDDDGFLPETLGGPAEGEKNWVVDASVTAGPDLDNDAPKPPTTAAPPGRWHNAQRTSKPQPQPFTV